MSCLRVGFFPAQRAWKSFIANFLKLRRSKTKLQTKYSAATSTNITSVQAPDPETRDSRVFLIRLKRGCLFKKKRKAVVYVDKLFRKPIDVTDWIPAKQWKLKDELLPEKGIDERAKEFITRMKTEMLASRNL